MQDFYEPKEGDVAPNFRLPSTRGKNVTLKEFRGKDVILYFYPKDDTPGCTTQACGLRDMSADLQARRLEFDDATLQDACYERGWTDGLPIVPPTETRVKAMLAGMPWRDAEAVIGVVPPRTAVVGRRV